MVIYSRLCGADECDVMVCMGPQKGNSNCGDAETVGAWNLRGRARWINEISPEV